MSDDLNIAFHPLTRAKALAVVEGALMLGTLPIKRVVIEQVEPGVTNLAFTFPAASADSPLVQRAIDNFINTVTSFMSKPEDPEDQDRGAVEQERSRLGDLSRRGA